MSKSRFDNLELERPAQDGQPRPKLSRFDKDQPTARAPEPIQHGVGHDLAPALQTNRFAASGDDGVVLELADDSQPFRRCIGCQRDSTRFETRCKFCGTALDSPEAVAFNAELWKQLQAEQATEKAQHVEHEAEAQRLSQQQYDSIRAAQKQVGQELAVRYSGGLTENSISMKWRIGFGLTGVSLLAISWQIPRYSLLRMALSGAGVICLILAAPAGAWGYFRRF